MENRESHKESTPDPVAIKLALSHQLENELDKTGFNYIVLLIDKVANPDVAVATNIKRAELTQLLRLIADRLEKDGVELS